MNPERFLGRDPAPGGLVAVDEGSAFLREAVLLLAEGRGRLDATVVDSPWRGSTAATIVDAVGDLRSRLDVLEGAVVDFSAAWQEWRHGLARRKDRTAQLVETVSQLGADDERRARVEAQVAELETEHEDAARVLATAADDLARVASTTAGEDDVAHGLRRGFADLDRAVAEWVAESGDEVERAGGAVADVSALTAVVPHLMGVPDGSDDSGGPRGEVPEAVRELAGTSPGSHRLLDALGPPGPHPEGPVDGAAADPTGGTAGAVGSGADAGPGAGADPVDVAMKVASLPEATFAPTTGPSLSERIHGRATETTEPEADGSGADPRGAAR